MTAMLTGREVALLLRRKRDWFYRNHGRLTAEHGFPPPVPGIGRPLWSRTAVEAWIDRDVKHEDDRAEAADWAARSRRVAARLAGKR